MRCPPGRILIPAGRLQTFVFLRRSISKLISRLVFFMDENVIFSDSKGRSQEAHRKSRSQGTEALRRSISYFLFLGARKFCTYYSWEAEWLRFHVHGRQSISFSCSWEAKYLIFSVNGRKNISYILFMGSKIWEENHLIFPVHGRQDGGAAGLKWPACQ